MGTPDHCVGWTSARMQAAPKRSLVTWLLLISAALALSARESERALALTPESAQVMAAVDRAVAYLETQNDPREGAQALVGLALLKARRDMDHPKVAEAVRAVNKFVNNLVAGTTFEEKFIYQAGVSLLFLLEIDDNEVHGDAIKAIISYLARVQKPHGGWGYPALPGGDTSMTQFVILCYWTADELGYETPLASWENVTNWLMRCQDPSGAFGYQGIDPGGFTPVEQKGVRHTMSVAGAGSLYMCGEHLKLLELKWDGDNSPPGFTKVPAQGQDAAEPITKRVDAVHFKRCRAKADNWMDSHVTFHADEWPQYFLYGLERYRSFRDLAEAHAVEEPEWYNQGAKELIDSQSADGSWDYSTYPEPVPNTCFGIMFLMRSMREVIRKVTYFDSGDQQGAKGLPDGDNIVVTHDGIKPKPLEGPAEQMIALLQQSTGEDFQGALARLDELTRAGDEELLTKNARALRDLARGGSPQARAAAVKALGRRRNLDDVPLLIEAYHDPDGEVWQAADYGLRFISRKFDGVLASEPEGNTGREAAVSKWKEWYVSVRPDAVFDE